MSNKIIAKQARAKRRTARTRSKFTGTPDRPRLSVFRSLSHISVQIIDDTNSRTLAAASDKEIKEKGTKSDKAIAVGKLIAQKAAKEKITKVVFDRGSYQYHGRVKALADAAREAGLEF